MYLLALLIVLASPSPAATMPAAALAPAAVSIKPVQWQGVTLGEDIDTVRARLGKPEFNRKVILGSMLVEYPVHGGEGTLLLETTEHQVTQIRVEAAAPKELGLPIGDPFGVNLGDSLTRLMTIRGDPTRSDVDAPDEATSTYGAANENRWVYTVRGGMVVAITLVAPKPPHPVNTGPLHPGLVLRGTPAPGRIVLRTTPTPKPSPRTTASAAPGATAVPTPVPGIALPGPTPKPTPAPAGTAIVSAAPSAAPSTAPSASALPLAIRPNGVPTPSGTPNPSPTMVADGSSPETAIPVRAPDMATGFDYIYRFIENISCGDTGQYRIVGQDLFSQKGHNYAKVTAECTTSHDRRAFFFDITYIFTRSER